MNLQSVDYDFLPRWVFIGALCVGIFYYSWWFDFSHVGNMLLYGLLFFGETYHIAMVCMFWVTIWPSKKMYTRNASIRQSISFLPTVAICIPVVSEPVAVVERTIAWAKQIDYPRKNIYILNDGYVAGYSKWEDYQILADTYGVQCVTRKTPGGAKAGNINHALHILRESFIAVFDADMSPQPQFLRKTMPYLYDARVAFVQTPQFYENYALNQVTKGAWEQQNFFFGPVMMGKNQYNASFICGTNFVIRKKALMDVGGFNEKNIAEDFLTSIDIHQNGWQSVYLPVVLASGYAPFTMGAYYQQQLRWSRGSLDVFFHQNPLWKRNLTMMQKIQYLSSALFYLNGIVVCIDMLIPILFLLFGMQPVLVSTTSFALYFIPYMVISLYIIYLTSRRTITFRTFSFSQSSFSIQLVALWSILIGKKLSFVVTRKEAEEGSYLLLCLPHILYIIIAAFAIMWGLYRQGFTAAYIANVAWVIFNISMFIPFILSSLKWVSPVEVSIANPALTS